GGRGRWGRRRGSGVGDRGRWVGWGAEPPLVWSSIGGDALTATGRGRGGRAMKSGDRGRRRLMPRREQVTWSDPTVTSMISAISSRVFPRSTRFLIWDTGRGAVHDPDLTAPDYEGGV